MRHFSLWWLMFILSALLTAWAWFNYPAGVPIGIICGGMTIRYIIEDRQRAKLQNRLDAAWRELERQIDDEGGAS